jgi:hypothetical protein
MVAQQVAEESDRSIKLSRTNTMTSTEFTVGATDRANKVLSFDASGEIAVTQELGTFKGNSATTTTAAYVVRDIVKGSTTAQLNNIYICIQASPVGTALTNTSYWVLIVDAVSAATSATAAASSATASANSATASANSATASANSATTSGNSATASANSATASANSATAAATSETNAEAAFDNFDDRYLGAKSSAPSTDNDGNALLTGALYFNSTSSQIFNWTSSAWEAIKPTSGEQTNINTLSASAVVADMAILATTDIVADMAILGTSDVVTDMNVLATSDVVTDMNVLGTADVVNDMNVLGSSATVTAMNLLGTSAVVTDMGILATTDVVADMAILATSDIVTDMNVLGTSANVTAMGLLGVSAVVTDMGILGTSDVVADMALLGTSANVSAMDLIGTSTVVANIATVAANVAGVNSFAERYRVGSSNPTSDLNEGDLFYNTTSNVVLFYNGSAWITIVAGNVTQTGSETLTNKTLTDAVAITNSVTGEIVPGKIEGTNFAGSLLIGHATTGTLNNAQNNTGVGIAALDNLTAGDFNTAIGYEAVSSVTTARYNTGLGFRTLRTTTGESNTAVGGVAMYGNYGGAFNTAVGRNSLTTNNTGDYNTALGYDSGKLITGNDSNYNLTLGTQAGDNITDGAGNVIIGSVDATSATSDRQLVIGGYDGSTTTTWISGDSSGNLVTPGTITANSVVLTGVAADDSITLAKMASGTDGNIISYDASGNPVAVATGSAGQVLTSAGAGAPPTFAAVSAANTPIVRAVPSGNQAISASTNTTVVFNTEVIDTDSAFASNTFTVPSGKAGKYYVSVTIIADTDTDDSLQRVQIRKNTSTNVGYANYRMSGTADNTITVFCIVDLAESDTILVNYYSYSVTSSIRSNAEYAGGTSLNIFKLI